MSENQKIRLNKFLSRAGVASRRKADELIKEGKVKVNGKVVREPGIKIDPSSQNVEVDDQLITIEEPVYYLFYKPSGYLTSLYDPHGRKTIKEFLKSLPTRVFPVGRLDAATEGLLLLTNDGELANRLLHPRYEIKRVYHATIKGHPHEKLIDRLLKEGVEVEGRRVFPKKIRLLRRSPRTSTYEIVVGEGRKREVRKIFASIGHPVVHLKRVAFGPLTLGRLRPGEIRPLSPKELSQLKKAASLEP
ncbi:pseudouridine synthase [Thermodesulfatator indicus DSM 15286]|uniref:Pseudouridine synthase n=1 Tax=Thermodesulfatator indicus (strain DSM 15286 / JCM 11887 / CIR29812) TaxID=667014 RepID=F8ADX1_THEID|nr:pseudouridine synthase [Thermodesulfatator indicus]AEH44936.1 pseudouridine synthase [Thermodesulfatator indicus DSM 15286]